MVSDDGRIKVLDFGLAKAVVEDGSRARRAPDAVGYPAGLIVGTPAYMSPEQAQGEHVDTRSDIFSLGIVFYEMLTGRRPFDGGNAASVISAILRDTPRPVTELQPAVPARARRWFIAASRRTPSTGFSRRWTSATAWRKRSRTSIRATRVPDRSSQRRGRRPTRLQYATLAIVAAVGAAAVASLVRVRRGASSAARCSAAAKPRSGDFCARRRELPYLVTGRAAARLSVE